MVPREPPPSSGGTNGSPSPLSFRGEERLCGELDRTILSYGESCRPILTRSSKGHPALERTFDGRGCPGSAGRQASGAAPRAFDRDVRNERSNGDRRSRCGRRRGGNRSRRHDARGEVRSDHLRERKPGEVSRRRQCQRSLLPRGDATLDDGHRAPAGRNDGGACRGPLSGVARCLPPAADLARRGPHGDHARAGTADPRRRLDRRGRKRKAPPPRRRTRR